MASEFYLATKMQQYIDVSTILLELCLIINSSQNINFPKHYLIVEFLYGIVNTNRLFYFDRADLPQPYST